MVYIKIKQGKSKFGVSQIKPEQIFGGDTVEKAAEIFIEVISGKGTEAQNNVVCANAGMAIATVDGLTAKEGFERAKESLLNGKGHARLKKLIELSK